uniref:uncharacterized protein LOC120891809 n=1 Tax=Ictidomys tridecemlineatus TaxID=43179 RepID=UPI001A9F3685|nr:uncharacterized protein LOC120891809 [Ictidomys tridecemlineatus]
MGEASLSHLAMVTKVLCCVVLCFLGGGKSPKIRNLNFCSLLLIAAILLLNLYTDSLFSEPTDAGVTQTPRHKVTQKGQTVTLRCEPHSNHDNIFWYRQTMVQGLELLVHFNNKLLMDDSGMPKDRFSAAMPETSFSTMKIQPTEPRDTAVYLCASSLATALQNHPVQVQKPGASFPFSNSQLLSPPGCSPILGRTRIWYSIGPLQGKDNDNDAAHQEACGKRTGEGWYWLLRLHGFLSRGSPTWKPVSHMGLSCDCVALKLCSQGTTIVIVPFAFYFVFCNISCFYYLKTPSFLDGFQHLNNTLISKFFHIC